jgi:hypothetical protein
MGGGSMNQRSEHANHATDTSTLRADALERRQLLVATNQVIFREINEKLEDLNNSFSEIIPLGHFVCECADTSCIERVGMTIREYEELRGHARRFVVRRGHRSPETERVIEERTGYTIVEKLGAAGDYAARFDPRTND